MLTREPATSSPATAKATSEPSLELYSVAPLADSRPDPTRWFAEEVQPHEALLRNYLRGVFPAVRDVDDVVQESYLRILRARAAQPIASAKAFLFQVARRLALDRVRRERHDFVADFKDADQVLSPRSVTLDDPAANAERIRLLADAIERLPERCREVFILRKLNNVSQKETAARLGLSERTVEVQVSRGMRRCEAYLRQRGITGLNDHDPGT